jgi:hypothetical protein
MRDRLEDLDFAEDNHTGSIELVLEWNPQGARRRSRPKKAWTKTTEDETMEDME